MSEALRKAAEQALEVIERYQVKRQDFDRFADEVLALRAALAEPEQSEPVKCKHEWFHTGAMEPGECRCIKCGAWNTTSAPPRREPLTDERALQIAKELGWMVHHSDIASDAIELIRAIESTHGIGVTP